VLWSVMSSARERDDLLYRSELDTSRLIT
jgi:hypothetical protein